MVPVPGDGPLLIVGASARAAAWSAVRAGLTPTAADRFADRDLASIACCVRVGPGDYPAGLVAAAETLPRGPWVYTGGIENHPGVVARLARRRPLWGLGPRELTVARDPFELARALRESGRPALGVRRGPEGLPRDGSWLRKPRASTGGYGIVPVGDLTGDGPTTRCYYQERADGLSLSALFVADRAGGSVLAGVSRQLIGRPGAPFAYRGSIGPWPVPGDVIERIAAVGRALAAGLRLVGLFGVDLVLSDDGIPWPVEVNPRYTASVEVIELATHRPLAGAHRDACEGRPCDPAAATDPHPGRFVAKAYVFADRDGVFRQTPDCLGDPAHPFRVPRLADVPAPGTPVGKGEPVLTVFAEGDDPAATLRALDEARAAWERRWSEPVKGS